MWKKTKCAENINNVKASAYLVHNINLLKKISKIPENVLRPSGEGHSGHD